MSQRKQLILKLVLECCIGTVKHVHNILAAIFAGGYFAIFVELDMKKKVAHKILTCNYNVHVLLQTVQSGKHVAATIAILPRLLLTFEGQLLVEPTILFIPCHVKASPLPLATLVHVTNECAILDKKKDLPC